MARDKGVATRTTYRKAVKEHKVDASGSATEKAERQARASGKLEPLVDPAGFDVIRLSLPRLVKKGDYFELAVGPPKPIETRVDTTSSMGDELNVALRVLPDAFESWAKALPGYDLQICTGIFGDVCDRFALCRPQFEMEATKIVKQLTLMVPERGGGDTPEDPDLGIFGGAYLCRHYINRIGLKGYDFTATDAPGRGMVSVSHLTRVYGPDVFKKVEENGHSIRQGTLQLGEVWEALLERAHGFVLHVPIRGRYLSDTTYFWKDIVGDDRLVRLPDTKYLPHVQATIMGLTEGTIALTDVSSFLEEFNIPEDMTKRIEEEVSKIPVGVEALAPNFSRLPKKGDLFEKKPDVWADTDDPEANLWPISGDKLKELRENVAEYVAGGGKEKDQWL